MTQNTECNRCGLLRSTVRDTGKMCVRGALHDWPTAEVAYCPTCVQMTNHRSGRCMKCITSDSR